METEAIHKKTSHWSNAFSWHWFDCVSWWEIWWIIMPSPQWLLFFTFL